MELRAPSPPGRVGGRAVAKDLPASDVPCTHSDEAVRDAILARATGTSYPRSSASTQGFDEVGRERLNKNASEPVASSRTMLVAEPGHGDDHRRLASED